jgi:hypothetical protein
MPSAIVATTEIVDSISSLQGVAQSYILKGEPTMTEQEKVQIDMKLEVVLLGVSDVDRAKAFYEKLGWRLDIDITTGDDFRNGVLAF